MVKNLPTNAGDIKDAGSIPELGRAPAGGHGNPLQYSCLENPMDRGAWQAIVQRVKKSRTWLKGLNMHTLSPGSRKACWGGGGCLGPMIERLVVHILTIGEKVRREKMCEVRQGCWVHRTESEMQVCFGNPQPRG